MGTFYSTIPRPNFIWDAKNPSTYGNATTVNNLIDSTTMDMVGVNANLTTQTYTFENPIAAQIATDYIREEVTDTTKYAVFTSGTSAAVTFKNTSLLDISAETWYRQLPFSFGTDSAFGQFQFERHYTNSSFQLRLKFSDEGAFGNTYSFGDIPLDDVIQLAFTVGSNALFLYVNGEVVNTIDISSKTLAPADVVGGLRLCIGALGTSSINPSYGFIGEIYNATHWKTELSPEEIRDFANKTIARYI